MPVVTLRSRRVLCPPHTSRVFDPHVFPRLVRWAENRLLLDRIQGIVCCGHSGLVLAGALGYVTRLPVIAVRKFGEPCVASTSDGDVSAIVPDPPLARWAWVDDVIASGGTMRRSIGRVWAKRLVVTPVPTCVLLYAYPASEFRAAVQTRHIVESPLPDATATDAYDRRAHWEAEVEDYDFTDQRYVCHHYFGPDLED
jgi:hypothetical protein